jgi:MFS family permease
MTAPAPKGRVADRWVGALRERDFRLFFTGQLTSSVGTQMAPVAIAFAVLGGGGSATDLGLVLMGQTVPLIIFVLAGGLLGDRIGPRPVMIVADVIRFVAHAALATAVLTGSPTLWTFLVVEVFIGTGDALFNPSLTGLVPQVVSRERLQQANALGALTGFGGQIVGPAVAGIIVAVSSPGWALAADAATYLVSAVCLLRIRIALVTAPPRKVGEQLRAGWREFSSRTWLWSVVVSAMVFLMLSFAPLFVLGAVVAKQSYGGAGAWGAILAAEGVGAVVATVILLRIHVPRPIACAVASTVLYALLGMTLALRAPLPVVVVAGFIGGLSFAMWETLWSTTVQREIPADVLAQVSAYDWLGSIALLPLGFALAGPLAGWLGVNGALWLGVIVIVVSTAVTLAVPDIRRVRAPIPEPAVA